MNYDAIYNAMFIVDTFISGSPETQYDIIGDNDVNFAYRDPISGLSLNGNFELNDSGAVSYYNYRFYNEINGLSLFTSVFLNGNYDDFLYHAYVTDALSKDQGVVDAVNYAVASGYGQDLAYFYDSLPGANPTSPNSTMVQIGEGELYYA